MSYFFVLTLNFQFSWNSFLAINHVLLLSIYQFTSLKNRISSRVKRIVIIRINEKKTVSDFLYKSFCFFYNQFINWHVWRSFLIEVRYFLRADHCFYVRILLNHYHVIETYIHGFFYRRNNFIRNLSLKKALKIWNS